jgi:hypothetical protein
MTGAFLERMTRPGSIWGPASPEQLTALWWLVFVSMWDDIGRYSAAVLSATGGAAP